MKQGESDYWSGVYPFGRILSELLCRHILASVMFSSSPPVFHVVLDNLPKAESTSVCVFSLFRFILHTSDRAQGQKQGL